MSRSLVSLQHWPQALTALETVVDSLQLICTSHFATPLTLLKQCFRSLSLALNTAAFPLSRLSNHSHYHNSHLHCNNKRCDSWIHVQARRHKGVHRG